MTEIAKLPVPPAPADMDSLPSSLRKAVAAPTEFVYPAGRSAVEVERIWTLPTEITPDLIAAARAQIPTYEAALRPAGPDAIRKWLLTLGTLCAGKISVEDASAKIIAYVGLLEVAKCALTRSSLIEAGRRFTWFPSFSEIDAFLNDVALVKRRILARLQAIAEAKPSLPAPDPGKPWSELTPEERSQFDAAMAKAMANLGGSRGRQQCSKVDVAKPVSQTARDLIARGMRPLDGIEMSSGAEEQSRRSSA